MYAKEKPIKHFIYCINCKNFYRNEGTFKTTYHCSKAKEITVHNFMQALTRNEKPEEKNVNNDCGDYEEKEL